MSPMACPVPSQRPRSAAVRAQWGVNYIAYTFYIGNKICTYMNTYTHAQRDTPTTNTHTHINTDTLVDNTRLTVVQLNGPTLYGSISSQSFSQSLEKSIQGLGLDASSNGRFQLFARSSAKCASACNKCLRPFAPRQP